MEELFRQKEAIEREIKRAERSNMHSQLIGALGRITQINEQVAIAQRAINDIWKQAQHIEEEIKSIVMKYCSLSAENEKRLRREHP